MRIFATQAELARQLVGRGQPGRCVIAGYRLPCRLDQHQPEDHGQHMRAEPACKESPRHGAKGCPPGFMAGGAMNSILGFPPEPDQQSMYSAQGEPSIIYQNSLVALANYCAFIGREHRPPAPR